MSLPVDLVVAIPAHDEEATIGACLDAVAEAVASARRTGAVKDAVVSVAAHRCEDATSLEARDVLGRAHLRGVVTDDPRSTTIGEVRQVAVSAALPMVTRPLSTLLLNTDADSLVPSDWVTGMLDAMRTGRARGAAGMVELHGWTAPPAARRAYAEAIRSGIRGTGHSHVYGANLAVWLPTFQALGGFKALSTGEDRDLVARLRAAGHAVATPLYPRVLTSARLDPRCPDGLGAFLNRLVAKA